MIDTLVVGFASVGLVGAGIYLSEEVARVRMHGREGYWHLGLLGMWIASLGQRSLSRLGIFLGGAVCVREVFSVVSVCARRWAHQLGEQILETNR